MSRMVVSTHLGRFLNHDIDIVVLDNPTVRTSFTHLDWAPADEIVFDINTPAHPECLVLKNLKERLDQTWEVPNYHVGVSKISCAACQIYFQVREPPRCTRVSKGLESKMMLRGKLNVSGVWIVDLRQLESHNPPLVEKVRSRNRRAFGGVNAATGAAKPDGGHSTDD